MASRRRPSSTTCSSCLGAHVADATARCRCPCSPRSSPSSATRSTTPSSRSTGSARTAARAPQGPDLRRPRSTAAINQTLSRTMLTALHRRSSRPSCSTSSGARCCRIWPSSSPSGVVTGTYSTIYIAAASLIVDWTRSWVGGRRLPRKSQESRSKSLILVAKSVVNPWRARVDPAPDADRGDSEVPAGRRPGPRPRAPTASPSARIEGQQRASGEPYLSHPLEVAGLLVNFKMDVTTVTAGLLHDVLEDTSATKDGSPAGVRRRDRRAGRRRHQDRQARLLLARGAPGRELPQDGGGHGARPARADDQARRPPAQHADARLPAAEKARKIAQETLDIYAPLAHRLGMAKVKAELEDLALRVLHPRTTRS